MKSDHDFSEFTALYYSFLEAANKLLGTSEEERLDEHLKEFVDRLHEPFIFYFIRSCVDGLDDNKEVIHVTHPVYLKTPYPVSQDIAKEVLFSYIPLQSGVEEEIPYPVLATRFVRDGSDGSVDGFNKTVVLPLVRHVDAYLKALLVQTLNRTGFVFAAKEGF